MGTALNWGIALCSLLLAGQVNAKEIDLSPQEAAEKSDAIKLTPSSGWNLEVADDRCILSRTFGTEAADHLLFIEQIAPGPHFDLTVAGSSLDGFGLGRWIYRGMRADRNLSSVDPLFGGIRGFGKSLLMPGIMLEDGMQKDAASARIDPMAAAAVERVVFRQGRQIVSFETDNMRPAIEALNTCATDLLHYWKIDPETHVHYNPPTMEGERTYFAKLSNRFSKSAGAKGHSAVLRIRAVIDPEGAVESCHHEYAATSGGEQIDVCEELSSVAFAPATDREGQAIRSFYTRSMALDPYSPFAADAHGGRIQAD